MIKKITFVILVCCILFSCGKKDDPLERLKRALKKKIPVEVKKGSKEGLKPKKDNFTACFVKGAY